MPVGASRLSQRKNPNNAAAQLPEMPKTSMGSMV